MSKAQQQQPHRQSLSVGWEVGEVSAALEGARRSLLFFRDEGQDLEDAERLQVLTELGAGLSLACGRLNLLIRALDGRTDPALLLGDHNAIHGPEDRLIAGVCLAAWPAGVKPHKEDAR